VRGPPGTGLRQAQADSGARLLRRPGDQLLPALPQQ